MNDNLEFHIKCKKGDIGRYVILPGDPARVEKIAKYLDDAKKVGQNREYTIYTGYLDGEKVSVCSTGIGGPSAAIAIEELANIGGDTFMRVGTAAAMDIDVMGGDLVIATAAIRKDGTGKEYLPIEFPAVANYDIITALVNSAQKNGSSYKIGVVHCKDSFYGQTSPEKMPISSDLQNSWKSYIDGGALCSEMESATLFAVGSYRKLRVGTVLLVASNQERERLNMESPRATDTEEAIRVAIDALKSLIKQDKNKPD